MDITWTNYEQIKTFKAMEHKRTQSALARIDTKKEAILADINLFKPLSMSAIRKKYRVSLSVLMTAFGRWGYDAEKLKEELRLKTVYNKSSSDGFISNADILATIEATKERLTKNNPDFFKDICADIGVLPPRVRAVYLANGFNVSKFSSKCGGHKMKTPDAKTLLSRAWV